MSLDTSNPTSLTFYVYMSTNWVVLFPKAVGNKISTKNYVRNFPSKVGDRVSILGRRKTHFESTFLKENMQVPRKQTL